jgi:cytochrome c-type protein NapB
MVLLEKIGLEKIGPEKIMLEKIMLEKIMRTIFIALVLTVGLAYGPAQAEEAKTAEIANVSNGGQASLRGLIELDVTRPDDAFKRIPRDRAPYSSAYVYQPPLIPHQILNYELSTNANKCLSCHSFKKARDSGATKISVTHYATREGQVLSDVSPRRYFCLQCHVPQVAADALIDNDFEPVDSLQ